MTLDEIERRMRIIVDNIYAAKNRTQATYAALSLDMLREDVRDAMFLQSTPEEIRDYWERNSDVPF